MRLVTFTLSGGAQRAGALIDGGARIVDLQAAHETRWGRASPHLASVLALLEGGREALDLAYQTLNAAPDSVPRGGAKLLAPIPAPPQMRDFLCFEKHLVQAFATARLTVPPVWYERPLHYHPNRLNVIGPDDDIEWPAYSSKLDFELEFGCYIGKKGRDIPREKALDHVAGYTIFNDVSARDEQLKEMPGQLGPGKGKDFDTGNVMGPCLVTADEMPDPYRLEMVVRVNGEEWGRGNSRDMHWKFEDCIAHVSRSETLYPGEFLASGTVGNGSGMEQMRFLEPDSVVELEVQGIGVLRNRVVRRTR